MKVKSVKQESILKQFYVYFAVASVIPLIVLIYLLVQYTAGSGSSFFRVSPKIFLPIAGVFSLLGFWGTRSFLVRIVSLSNKLKSQTLDLEKIDKNTILELAKGDEEVAQLAKVFSEIIANLEKSVQELKQTKQTLYKVLSNIGKAVGSIENFNLLIKFILETVIEALGAKRGAIFVLEENDTLKPKAVSGIDEKLIPQKLRLGEEAAGWVVKEKKPLMVPAFEKDESNSLFASPLAAVPLILRDKVWGAIVLSGKKENNNFSEEELRILSNLGYQIAVSFENFTLNTEVEKIYFETISALALAVEAKDFYSRGHSERVAKYAVKIAGSLGLPQEDLDALRDAARLHDIGKIGITDEILHKADKLTSEERMIMNKHPQIGDGIVRPLRNFSHIINPIRHHHELLDGSGYPDGLKGEDIPLITRVLTVSDIFDALTSDRPYRKALSIDETKREFSLMVDKGKLDKDVVAALFKLIEENKLNQEIG
ncbi:MAG: HD domain-containing protein [Candidatus Omnitrophota bacterium]|nr:HD domain-containing protein [Candidatus Omnitrophota bacterium]